MSEPSTDPLKTAAALAAQSEATTLKAEVAPLDQKALDLLLMRARSHNGWLDKGISDEVLHDLYNTLRWGPTSMNCAPARFVFLRSEEAKQRLKPSLAPTNIDKVLAAPVTVIIASDQEFYRHMPELFPHRDVSTMFSDNLAMAHTTAFRNSTLQGAYLMLTARAMGLDCGPMSGFDNQKLDEEFFADSSLKSNFLCCLGYGDNSKVFQRLPRLDFASACELI